MLSTLRSFSKGKLATILVTIIIIPFVFWGMGSVFRGGKTNSVAKINSFNISTKDFIDHINNSKLSADKIKENINNNILEEFLTELVSNSVIDIEIEDLNIRIGIHQGDIFIKDGDVFGDDVNITSRIESFSPIGGICVSEKVYNDISSSPEISSEYLGYRRLKGIENEMKL
ncbi:MAG: hypothetical protein COB63_04790, partial [Candidatus Pelagibacter sp.]